jgi:hypothetical protein
MSEPAVTVVITCFNYGRYLPESIGSVLAQTLTDFELLVVDDGSTDDSVAIARRLAAGDPRVTVIAQENAGQPAIPRNLAVGRARAPYVVCLDADDRLDPEMLARCAAVLDADDGIALAYPRTAEFGDSEQLHPHLDWSLAHLVRCNFLPCCTMYRRAAFLDAGGYNTNVRGYEDWDLWLGIAATGARGRPAPGALWHYRKHGGGVYSESTGGDQRLKAQVVVNRPLLFTDAQLAWAHGVLAGDAQALAITAPLGHPPALDDPPRSTLQIARDRSVRADWYLDAGDVVAPWPGRSLAEAIEQVDRLGFTAIRAGGAIVARKRATDPIEYPVPFFTAATPDAQRAAQLADALEHVVLAHSLRAASPLAADSAARYAGVAPHALPELLARTQALIAGSTGSPAVADDEIAPLLRLAGVVRGERLAAGDRARADAAAAFQQALHRIGLEDARRVAVLAYGDELLADPTLLAAYGTAFGAGDDVTLVIATADGDVASLLDAVAAAGLDGEGSPDMIAVPQAPHGVDAVLSRREHAGVPRFDETTLASLRALAAAA